MHTIGIYRQRLERKKGYVDSLRKKVSSLEEERAITANKEIFAEEALTFIQRIAQETQGQIKVHMEDIVTTALSSVFDDPYTFEMDFVLRRNKTECDLLFSRNGKTVSPMDASGGGAVDVASFALRLALWSLDSVDNVIVFDEPFRFVSKEFQPAIASLLKKLSEQLGLQIIMVTHNENLIKESVHICGVTQQKGESCVISS
jgi:ABC-type glutathione transport system ATPase component